MHPLRRLILIISVLILLYILFYLLIFFKFLYIREFLSADDVYINKNENIIKYSNSHEEYNNFSSVRLVLGYNSLLRIDCKYLDNYLNMVDNSKDYVKIADYSRIGATGLYLRGLSFCNFASHNLYDRFSKSLIENYGENFKIKRLDFENNEYGIDKSNFDSYYSVYSGESLIGLIYTDKVFDDLIDDNFIDNVVKSNIDLFNGYIRNKDYESAANIGMWTSEAIYVRSSSKNGKFSSCDDCNIKHIAESLEYSQIDFLRMHITHTTDYLIVYILSLKTSEFYDVISKVKYLTIVNSILNKISNLKTLDGYKSYNGSTDIRIDNNSHLLDAATFFLE